MRAEAPAPPGEAGPARARATIPLARQSQSIRCVPRQAYQRAQRVGDSADPRFVLGWEAARFPRIDVDLSHDLSPVAHQHDQLRSDVGAAGEVFGLAGDVADVQVLLLANGAAAQPAATRDPHVLGGRADERTEHQLVAAEEIDPGPGVPREGAVERVHRCLERGGGNLRFDGGHHGKDGTSTSGDSSRCASLTVRRAVVSARTCEGSLPWHWSCSSAVPSRPPTRSAATTRTAAGTPKSASMASAASAATMPSARRSPGPSA